MAYGFLVLQPSNIPSDWKCPVCQENDQKAPVVAHVRCIKGMDERQVKIYSNGGEKHPIHEKCLKEAFAQAHPECPVCRKELIDLETFVSSKSVVKGETRPDGAQTFKGKVRLLFLPFSGSLENLPPFLKE